MAGSIESFCGAVSIVPAVVVPMALRLQRMVDTVSTEQMRERVGLASHGELAVAITLCILILAAPIALTARVMRWQRVDAGLDQLYGDEVSAEEEGWELVDGNEGAVEVESLAPHKEVNGTAS